MRLAAPVLAFLALAGSASAAPLTGNGRLAYACGNDVCTSQADGRDQRLAILNAAEPAWSPDGSSLAYTSGGAVFTGPETESVFAHLVAPAGREPAWSPDGRQLAYIQTGGSGGLHVVAVDGTGDGVVVGTDANGTPAQPDWSPDGRRLVFTRSHVAVSCSDDLCTSYPDAATVVVAPVAGGAEQTVAPGADPAWSPDGARIAYVRNPCLAGCHGTPRIMLYDVATGASTDTGIDGLSPAWSPDGARLVYAPYSGGVYRSSALDGSDAVDACRLVLPRVDWQPVAPGSEPAGTGDRCAPPVYTTAFPASEQTRPWTKDPVQAATLSAGARSVRIRIPGVACESVIRTEARRRPGFIDITVVADVIGPSAGGLAPSCPPPLAATRTVVLRGRLGRRTIRDGSTSPPTVRYAPPPARPQDGCPRTPFHPTSGAPSAVGAWVRHADAFLICRYTTQRGTQPRRLTAAAVVRRHAAVRRIRTRANLLPVFPAGAIACPIDFGDTTTLFAESPVNPQRIAIDPGGCGRASDGNTVRTVATGDGPLLLRQLERLTG